MTPRATYRLQFHKEFGFDDAANLAGYLAKLGVSHVYASPWLKARPGSRHGYDIVDHHVLNPELGDQAAFDRMVTALAGNSLGQILDFVPNHMGVGGSDNPLWLDVLEWGPDSPHSGWFDIDWQPDRFYVRGKLLTPFLGDQYGVELHGGKLSLKFDEEAGTFAVWAYDSHKLPVCPLQYHRILGDDHAELERLGDAFKNLPEWRPQVGLRAAELKAELAGLAKERPDVRDAIAAAVARFNGTAGDEESWRNLHALIQDQNWRAAHFRVAADDINYRRFFNINDLAGIRMELPEVFDHAHALVFRLLDNRTLDGLRIDHVDGLLNPKEYFNRLRAVDSASDRRTPFYLVVEKILAQHENLREDWPLDGTTGYEFLNLVLGLLIDPAGVDGFTRTYAEFTGERQSFAEVVRECKLRIMRNEMSSELDALARYAVRVAHENPKTADFTHNILRRAIREVVASFPVYRTYVDTDGTPSKEDRRDLDWAMSHAREHEADLDPSVFDFLYDLLSGDLVAKAGSGFSRYRALRCAMRFQQYSGPVMAKGLEDTAFYRYNRFIALNEVGGHPDQFGITLSAFHKANAQRARRWPNSMLATSTHDTKRGEDTRARLAVLSEMPDEWARQVQTWSRILRAHTGDAQAGPPDRNDEYMFYQLLVGTWPVELGGNGPPQPASLESYTVRLKEAMTKSVREAKVHSSWAAPNGVYEDGTLNFVEYSLRSDAFLASFLPFEERVSKLGMRNSLAQTVLKLTAPGVPDIYQGAELWNLSLVDPDNRRPVDYGLRMGLLEEIGRRRPDPAALLEHWRDGAIKLFILSSILNFRREVPELFASGEYEPAFASGARAEHVCAFLRKLAGRAVLVAVTRFPARLQANPGWEDTLLNLPEGENGRWQDVLTGREIASGPLAAGEIFAQLPVAVLARE